MLNTKYEHRSHSELE